MGAHVDFGMLDLSFSGCRKVEKEGGGGGEEGTKSQSRVHWLLEVQMVLLVALETVQI